MAQTKLIPTTIWNSLPELDLNVNDDLFTQISGDVYRPVRVDVASVTVPDLTPGTINQSAPNIGDTLTVTGSNAPAGATFQWQLNGSDIFGATSNDLNTLGMGAGAVRRGVSAGNQGPVYTASVTLSANAGLPGSFTTSGWSVADAGTDGDAILTIQTLPADGGSALTGLFARIGGTIVSLGAANTGNYPLNDLFTNGIATAISVFVSNAQGNGPESANKSVTTTGAPDVYSAPSIDQITETSARVLFGGAPDDNGAPFISRGLRYSADGGQNWTVIEPASLPQSLTGLGANLSYLVQTRATNANGPAPAWSPSTTFSTLAGDITPPMITELALETQTASEQPISFELSETADLAWVLSSSASKPSRGQILAGQDHTGAATAASGNYANLMPGAGFSATLPDGLNGTYYVHISVTDANGNAQPSIYTTAGFAVNTVIASDIAPFIETHHLDGAAGSSGTYTISAATLGEGDIYIGIAVAAFPGRPIQSVTVNGLTATEVELASNAGGQAEAAIYKVNSTVLTGDVVVTLSDNTSKGLSVFLWGPSATSTVVDTQQRTGFSPSDPWSEDLSVNTVAGGKVLAVAACLGSAVPYGQLTGISAVNGTHIVHGTDGSVQAFESDQTGAETPRTALIGGNDGDPPVRFSIVSISLGES
ncbi:MAG: fibronectin type III domain-containing protein [Pseudomonadota bacterium]